jgi:hypothetical protein
MNLSFQTTQQTFRQSRAKYDTMLDHGKNYRTGESNTQTTISTRRNYKVYKHSNIRDDDRSVPSQKHQRKSVVKANNNKGGVGGGGGGVTDKVKESWRTETARQGGCHWFNSDKFCLSFQFLYILVY